MGKMGRLGLLVLACALLGPAGTTAAHSLASKTQDEANAAARAQPVVMGARIGEHPGLTRFVLELSDPVTPRVFTLANPDRVVIDLPDVLWRIGAPDRPSGLGSIRSYRYGSFRPGESRIVIDLNRPVSLAPLLLIPPKDGNGYRIVLDLAPATPEEFARNAGWPEDVSAKRVAEGAAAGAAEPSTETASAARVIVVDAGHGGADSGTIGINGTREKDLVLDEAKRLASVLRKRGYIVHLTRDSDVYIPLEQRVRAARDFHADLFISLHADSNPSQDVYGASVYTLSEAGSDREAAELARKENQSDIVAGVDLSGQSSPVASILIGLAQRDTINRSIRFAETLVGQLGRVTDTLPRDPHRSAAFVVLKAPDVPAVLIELGYLTSPRDCVQMATEQWRNDVSFAIADAVDRQLSPTAANLKAADAMR
ncbi:MAG TPA: N-acetylmuramoyl-L-alanine amidase [Rhizomicrobium sp.]|nr:N-acetylmuramoyl-L-alanine amidase [Rhizomicrobium sp.]